MYVNLTEANPAYSGALPVSATSVLLSYNDTFSTASAQVNLTQQVPGEVGLTASFTGLSPNGLHQFHIHQTGDLSDGCTNLGPAYSINGTYVGQLGNITADENGEANVQLTFTTIELAGPYSVLGRAMQFHWPIDDSPLSYGSMACGVIGLA